MNNNFRKFTAFFLCLIVAFCCVLSGCSKEEKHDTKDRVNVEDKIDISKATSDSEATSEVLKTEVPTEAPTMKPTKEPTEAPTEKPVENPTVTVKKPATMLGFRNLTIEDVISIYGTNYIVSPYLYLGGAGSFGYKGDPNMYTFYYRCNAPQMGTIPSVKDKLIIISTNGFALIDDAVDTSMNGAKVESARPGGEWCENVETGHYSYVYEMDTYRVHCFWENSETTHRPMVSAEVWFY